MTKIKKNSHRYALLSVDNLGREHRVWVENRFEFSLHLNDRVVVCDKDDHMTSGRIIRRSNSMPYDLAALRIVYTANQFPVETDRQPELCTHEPVVPLDQMKLDRVQDAKSYLKNAIEQLEKI